MVWFQYKTDTFRKIIWRNDQLCKIVHFMLPQIFSDWQPIVSTQQDASLWTVGRTAPGSRTVTQNNEWWNASQNKLTASFTFPRPPCLFLSHSRFLLNTPLKLKASLVLSIEEWMQVERHLFLFHLSKKMSLLLALIGSGLTAFSYWGQVQYVSTSSQHFHFFQTQRCLSILFSSRTTKHCHLSCSTLQSTKEKQKFKSKIEEWGWKEWDKKTCCSFIRQNYLLRENTQ